MNTNPTRLAGGVLALGGQLATPQTSKLGAGIVAIAAEILATAQETESDA